MTADPTGKKAGCEVSVVMPCLNAGDTIAVQLEALAGQEFDGGWEVVVGENGSTDDTRRVIEEFRNRIPGLRIEDASQRRGPSYAMNTAVAAAAGRSIVICDADDEVAPGWLAAMAAALRKHAFVACRTDIEKLNAPWVRASHSNPQGSGVQRLSYAPYAPHAGAGTLGVRRSVHELLNGFDEDLPFLLDTDYCIRAQRMGADLCFVPDAVVHVRYRAAIGGLFGQARRWARYSVLIHKLYRENAARSPDAAAGYLKACWKLVRRLPRVRDRAALASWLWRSGWQAGRLQGCLMYRVGLF